MCLVATSMPSVTFMDGLEIRGRQMPKLIPARYSSTRIGSVRSAACRCRGASNIVAECHSPVDGSWITGSPSVQTALPDAHKHHSTARRVTQHILGLPALGR